MSLEPFIIKYQPRVPQEIIGQDRAFNELKDYVRNYSRQRKKGLILYGPSGTGKTSSVYVIASLLSLEVLEINASDVRNAAQINDKIGSALGQQSLFSRGKLLLIDEIDGLAGNKDRGGIQALTKLMARSPFPVIFTAIDPWQQKLSKLRSKCETVEFHALSYLSISGLLKSICAREGINADDSSIKALARLSAGDARAATNDLQMLSGPKKELTKESLESLGLRDKEESILNALMKVLKTTDENIAIEAFAKVNEDFDEIMLWLDENLPKEYTKAKDLARAYDNMSRADVFRGRIRRWQHWRFLVYMNALLSAGIAVSKDNKYSGYIKYTKTSRILKMFWAKQKRMKKEAIAQKIALHTHTSRKQALYSTLPYIQRIFRENPEQASLIADELDLNNEEIQVISK